MPSDEVPTSTLRCGVEFDNGELVEVMFCVVKMEEIAVVVLLLSRTGAEMTTGRHADRESIARVFKSITREGKVGCAKKYTAGVVERGREWEAHLDGRLYGW